jgi:ribosomal protein S17E
MIKISKTVVKKKAEDLYNKYFKEIVNKYGNKETNSIQLNKIGKKLFGKKFKGVFASDQIPIMRGGQYAIINLDDSSKNGSHWISLVKGFKGHSYVYDSFGRKHWKIIPSLVQSGNGVILETEDDKEQSIDSEACGQHSLSFLCVYDKLGWGYAKWI